MAKISVSVPDDLWFLASAVYKRQLEVAHELGHDLEWHEPAKASHIVQNALREYAKDYEVQMSIRRKEA